MISTRKKMLALGYKAHKLLTSDPETAPLLETRWHIIKGDNIPRAGDIQGGYTTKKDAWRAAEDYWQYCEDAR